ncbi:hypothetical protein [Cellulomonas sp. URHE0023]|uniref:hypothetical protein n=1 Tax=Cellulomonas sp. URHE0023 TaxID=1380354 RepID=UPI0004878628|nr:hypothetical protein [Cellulomonas sp. URHE0023]
MGAQQPPPRLPARVYWVRRLVVLGIPLLVIVLLVAWIATRGDGGSTPAAQTTTTTAPPASTDAPASAPAVVPSTEPGGVADCDATTLAISMTATAESFGPGVPPTFNVSITNIGGVPCLVDAGEASREIVITSGADRIWSNRDCIAAGSETRDLLLPEGGSDATQLAWNRVRSAPGCPPDLPAPGAGTYSAQFTLAGAVAAPAVFGLG